MASDRDPGSWPGSVGPEEDDEDEERDGGDDDGHSGCPQRCQRETQRSDAHFHAKFVWEILTRQSRKATIETKRKESVKQIKVNS